MWYTSNAGLVEYGIGRFVDERGAVRIEEPLALLGIEHHFNSVGRSIEATIGSHLQVNQGYAFEEVVLLAVTRLLPGNKLGNIFDFHGEKPQWADCSANIFTTSPNSDALLPFSIDNPFDAASIVAYSAKTPEAVKHWLEAGREGWCIPHKNMGPDLMARLELSNGRRLLLVIQAKCHIHGNKETLTAGVTAHAINTLIPRDFFQPNVRCKLISSCIFIHFYHL
jgi:hypothetical protein